MKQYIKINTLFNLILTLIPISSSSFTYTKFGLQGRLNIKIVYDELDARFVKYEPLSLARGTPELFPPTFLLEALSNISLSKDLVTHEYMPAEGNDELRKEIALLYSSLINQPLDLPNVEITMGATGGIFMTVAAHNTPGDQWIILEPAFEEYYIAVQLAGGVTVSVPLKKTSSNNTSSSFAFDKNELSKAFNWRTKGIFVNNPHNPTGKTFTKEELLFIGELAIKWDTMIIVDEVYEWMNYGSADHIRMASLGEAIFNRTITISSMSKTFYGSGFRVGWTYGPSNLIRNINAQQRFADFSRNSYAQIASAKAINKIRLELKAQNEYLADQRKAMQEKRDLVIGYLNQIGIEPIIPDSGFFIYANWTNVASRATDWEKEEGPTKDWKFVSWLVKNVGVLVLPGSGLYHNINKHFGEDFVRFSFVKENEQLNKAGALLLAKLKLK